MLRYAASVLLLPCLALAAIVSPAQRGGAGQSVLRFEGGQEEVCEKHGTVMSAPAFCNGLDCPRYTLVKKCKTYEVRDYVVTKWVSTTSVGIDFDQAQYTDFTRLFHYISGSNKQKEKITMTAPVIDRIIPGQGPACENNFTMSFFMAPKVVNPPEPSEATVFLSGLPTIRVYVRSFSGFAEKQDWLDQAVKLADDLEKVKAKYVTDYYYTAGYDSPFKFLNRHNEIWFIAQ